MKRLLVVISSVASTVMAMACDSEYVEQAHRQGRVLIIVAAAIALTSWAIGLWKRLGRKARYLSRSFGFMVAFNIAVLGVGNLLEKATDYDDSPLSLFFLFLMLLLPIIDTIWIILTFVFWRNTTHR